MALKAGININLISIERLTAMGSREKIRFILNEVKRGNVLVLERGLTAREEAELIKTTMASVDQDTFIGIEMQSYSHEDVRRGSWLDKLLRRKQPPRMSVIGPADLLKTIHKDGSMIQTMVLTRESIVGGEGKEQKKELPPPPEEMRSPEKTAEAPAQPSSTQSQDSPAYSSDPKKEEINQKEKEHSEEG